jgi:hypothetical protein
MKKPMTTYKAETVKLAAFEFKAARYGRMLYAEKGSIKTYVNRTQATNKCDKLQADGHNVAISLSYPFVIMLVK